MRVLSPRNDKVAPLIQLRYTTATMPEMPEVETIRRDLAEHLVGCAVQKVLVLEPKSVRNRAAVFVRLLQGQKFISFERRGKLLAIQLDAEDVWLLVHLRMTGQLILTNADAPIEKHTRLVLLFSGNKALHFKDIRKFGYFDVVSPEYKEHVFAKFGIEPLTPLFILSTFRKMISMRAAPIKSVLLNQKIIAGIGNIYADEVCFVARVQPMRPARSLTAAEITRLYRACQHILKQAIAKRGTSFRNYVDGFGAAGGYTAHLQVYARKGKPCVRCGRPLCGVRLAGRSTVFCPACQK